MALVLGRCPRLMCAAPLALITHFLVHRPGVSRAVNGSLHYVNIDLGDVVLLQTRSHFCLQLPGIDSTRDIEEKYHLSLVFVERGTLKPTLVRDEQRLHRAKDRLGILLIVESDSDSAARVRIKPVDKYPTEGGNEYCHGPRSHAAREPDYHDHDCFPG